MLRIVLGATGVILAIALLALNLSPFGRTYVPAGTGIVAKQMCSLMWVSGLDGDQAREMYLDPLLGGFAPYMSADIDEDDREVRAGVFGLFWKQRAVYREGLGCSLVHNADRFDFDLAAPRDQDFIPFEIDTAHRDTNFDVAALERAVETAFEGEYRNTLGVAIFHDGALVAEHYAPGASRETRFHGWSMTKSWAATLAGLMVESGQIDIHADGEVPALAEVDRGDVTINHLLRMAGGMKLHETNTGYDPNSEMLFGQPDMAFWAARQPRLHAPGEQWGYMSGNTVLATHAMQHLLGDDLVEQVTTLRTRLYEPLGIHSAIIESDQTGTWQGSSYMYATAHDWARLAMLYMNDGVAPDGTRLLPEDWYETVATPTPGSDEEYGLGFWLPLDGSDLPENTIMMSGFQGQWAYIMPTERVVVVRFGATNYGGSRSGRLALDVLAAIRPAEEMAPETPVVEED